MTLDQISRKAYGINPFIEVQRVAEYLRENSESDDRIAVFGSEPQIYFHSQRRSATGYIYMYPMMEEQRFVLRMQHEMISEIESVKPEYFVCVNIPTSWLITSSSPTKLLDWYGYGRYSRQYYEIVGLVESCGGIRQFFTSNLSRFPCRREPNTGYRYFVACRKNRSISRVEVQSCVISVKTGIQITATKKVES